nr:23S rRNA (uracil(1939)-C(5))-methyltransferase RlmD [Tissierella sp.]
MKKESVQYVKPPCPYYERCGGCQLQHISNESQNEYKQNIVVDLLGKFGKVEELIAMDYPYEYRNKIQYSFGYGKDKTIIAGMYARSTHKIIDIEKCIVQDPIADKIIISIKRIMKKYKMEPYNEDTGEGFLRHVLIRTGFTTGEVMVVLVTSHHEFKGKQNFVKILRKNHPEIATMVLNVNNRNTSMILGDTESNMYGRGFIEDIICGMKFRISSKSFYQINPQQAAVLYSKAIEMANFNGSEKIIDAYSGVGTISLIVSKNVKEVIGVEINNDGVRDAIRNAKNNNIDNVYFHRADAGEFMVELASRNEKVDAVIMNPPRAGSDEAFLSSTCLLDPEKIIYISCNPETLARDLEYLVKKGYKVKKMQPVDMFPQTNHVECIALIEKE